MVLQSLVVLVLLQQLQALAKPVFNEASYSANITETDSSDYDIPEPGFINATCTDADTPNDNITYTLEGVTSDVFTIDSIGRLHVERELDYDTGDVSFLFMAVCRDDSGGSDTASISITILPVNEHTPQITLTPTQDLPLGFLNGYETDMTIGRVIVSQIPNEGDYLLTVVDKDAGQDGEITYNLKNGGDIVSIDPETGTVVIESSLDTDKIKESSLFFGFTFRACDQDSCDDSGNIQILVLDDADEDPMFEESLYQVSLPEGTGSPTTVVIATCTDRDHDKGKFKGISFVNISSVINSLFLLNNLTGEVILKRQLDYEKMQHIEFKLQCTDTADFKAVANISLTIEAINDELPYFGQNKSYLFSLPSTSKINYHIGRVDAYDDDLDIGGSLTYHIEDNPYYSIDQETGNIALLQNADSINESLSVYSVRVSDGIHISSTEIVLQITTPFIQTTLGIAIVSIAGTAVGFLVILSFLVVCYCCYQRKKSKTDSPVHVDINVGREETTHIYDVLRGHDPLLASDIKTIPNPGYKCTSKSQLNQSEPDYEDMSVPESVTSQQY